MQLSWQLSGLHKMGMASGHKKPPSPGFSHFVRNLGTNQLCSSCAMSEERRESTRFGMAFSYSLVHKRDGLRRKNELCS